MDIARTKTPSRKRFYPSMGPRRTGVLTRRGFLFPAKHKKENKP